jgi:hypothetical protein
MHGPSIMVTVDEPQRPVLQRYTITVPLVFQETCTATIQQFWIYPSSGSFMGWVHMVCCMHMLVAELVQYDTRAGSSIKKAR